MKKIIALAIAAGISSAAFAAPETYTIESTHTLPRFEYNHLGYSVQLSRFANAHPPPLFDMIVQAFAAFE